MSLLILCCSPFELLLLKVSYWTIQSFANPWTDTRWNFKFHEAKPWKWFLVMVGVYVWTPEQSTAVRIVRTVLAAWATRISTEEPAAMHQTRRQKEFDCGWPPSLLNEGQKEMSVGINNIHIIRFDVRTRDEHPLPFFEFPCCSMPCAADGLNMEDQASFANPAVSWRGTYRYVPTTCVRSRGA